MPRDNIKCGFQVAAILESNMADINREFQVAQYLKMFATYKCSLLPNLVLVSQNAQFFELSSGTSHANRIRRLMNNSAMPSSAGYKRDRLAAATGCDSELNCRWILGYSTVVASHANTLRWQ